MIQEIATQWTTTINSEQPNKKLVKSEEITSDNTNYTLNTYLIENYGEVVYAKPKGRNDGDFRKVRAMVPFEFIDKKAKDFNWNVYECDMEPQKKLANAFIINFKEFEKEGKGLYIYSQTKGSGKTLLASCLINQLIDTMAINPKFITVLDFIELTKKGFKFESSNEEVDNLINSRLLVLDDLGVQMKKEWTDTVLYRLINYRMTKKLVTIFTSNISVDKLKIDDRISDRIFSMTIPLILPEVSIRNMKAREENAEFIRKLI